ncbi:hypothetical protein SIO70_03160 [Chitinophaga sancti]|uniref:hypothetical protein n=1 Tax=Chitinophaga sancti TaxID=1004 RepID=UPI002A75E2AB|nr:hypothetical protein [Chitinophaga sancti]WPQ63856.1 hypothetical protein SIO70_03160 [Chitinophaga sancti]
MKTYMFVMPVCMAFACKQSAYLPEGRKIPLGDSVGVITIQLPSEYDTAFSFVHYEMGKDYLLYRYQPKTLPLDNSDRLTVYLSIDKIADTAEAIHQLFSRHEQLLIDTTMNINGNQFYIYESNFQQDSFFLQTVEASTVRKGRTLTLLFEKRSPDADTSFIESSRNALLAMRID